MMMRFGRLESVGMKSKAGQAKILGTVVCVGGAMLLSFYHGHAVIGESSIHWKYADGMVKENSTNHHHSKLGPFLIIASTVSWAIWLIIQTRMSEKYAVPCTISALICLMASSECGIIGLFADRNISAWSLSPPGIRLFSSLYAETVCTAAFCLMSWCIQRKGPPYVSVFSPLLLIIVAILSYMLERSGLIVKGLYAVLWGKNGEMNVKSNAESLNPEEEEEKQEVVKSDLEIHFFGPFKWQFSYGQNLIKENGGNDN